jgi:hypothetical protein
MQEHPDPIQLHLTGGTVVVAVATVKSNVYMLYVPTSLKPIPVCLSTGGLDGGSSYVHNFLGAGTRGKGKEKGANGGREIEESRGAEKQRSRGAEEQRSRAAKLCFGGRPSVAEYEAAMAGGNKRQKRKDGVEGAV